MYSGGEGAARESFIIEHQQRGDPKEFSKKKRSPKKEVLSQALRPREVGCFQCRGVHWIEGLPNW